MSIVDEIKKLTAAPQEHDSDEARKLDDSQIRSLEEVEETLKEIGVTLEPKFDISLGARIGAGKARRT
jgi:hypothetical protein